LKTKNMTQKFVWIINESLILAKNLSHYLHELKWCRDDWNYAQKNPHEKNAVDTLLLSYWSMQQWLFISWNRFRAHHINNHDEDHDLNASWYYTVIPSAFCSSSLQETNEFKQRINLNSHSPFKESRGIFTHFFVTQFLAYFHVHRLVAFHISLFMFISIGVH